jgi:crotonobetainyl-CoA:carnitine CoA-transferase CaiB-like acyl-CoA transferase
MVNKALAINLWQVISFRNNEEYSSFYKTVLLNKKAVAIKIDNDEFQELADRLWSQAIQVMDQPNPQSLQV